MNDGVLQPASQTELGEKSLVWSQAPVTMLGSCFSRGGRPQDDRTERFLMEMLKEAREMKKWLREPNGVYKFRHMDKFQKNWT